MGIDLSTNAGVAVCETGYVLHAGVANAPKLTGMPRINAIVGSILHTRETFQPDLIVIEDYALGVNMGSVIIQVQIATVLQFCLWQDGIDFHLCHPSTLKKFVTGKGNAKKELMMLEVFKRWGHSASVNDEADAVALAQIGLAAHQCAINVTKAMEQVAQEWWKSTKGSVAQPQKKPLQNRS